MRTSCLTNFKGERENNHFCVGHYLELIYISTKYHEDDLKIVDRRMDSAMP